MQRNHIFQSDKILKKKNRVVDLYYDSDVLEK